ncbi:MAG TPA: class I SAM-dependent methyltransferase [Terriglobia bacterium]|nr:class I SAM-dependent methyltransferase [Terriglobia bacterium]
MRADYGQRYRELYERHWWWRAREAAILDVLRAHQPPRGWTRILDVGCGDGLFFEPLSQFGEVEGVEAASDLVNPEFVRSGRVHVCAFDQRFQPGKRYSLVLMLDVLEHLPDPAQALQHALSLLEPEGALLVTVPAFRLLWTNHDVLNAHFTRYTKRTFRELARQAGLRIETARYLFQWVFPAKLAARVGERLFRTQPRPPTIPPLWINEGLYALSRLEERTMGALPWPFGSSLMVLGSKPAAA